MPFKSEKQRKYLWANEPAIARDWTDTYGSRIQKAGGGIGQLVQPGPGRPGYQGDRPPSVRGREHAARGQTGGGDAGHLSHNVPPQLLTLPSHPEGPKEGPKIDLPKDGLLHTGLKKAYNLTANKKRIKNYRRMYDEYLTKRGVTNIPTTLDDEDDLYSFYEKDAFNYQPTVYDEFSTEEYADPNIMNYGDWMAEYQGSPGVKHSGNVGGLNKYVKTRNPDGSPATYGYTRETGGEGPIYYPGYVPGGSPGSGGGGADDVDDTDDLGGGHFKVPDEYILAEGGRAGYQEGNMVGGEMQGAEMEGAMMQSKEVIKELYDAFIAQGLSPQEAIEKIKQIIAGAQSEEPESPMMGEEFPGQEFGGGPRASAAFGGIMDTYTGRRKYGIGSFLSKAFKKVKKLASSKLGKLALMYAAGTYLGGTQAFGGTGWGSGAGATPWKKFGAKLLDPTGGQGIGNIFNPTGGLGEGKGWGMFQKATPIVQASTKYGAADVIDKANRLGVNPVKSDWSKWILPASIGAGAYTKYAPLDELDDTTGEWDEKKEAFDKYLASLDTGDSYRIPDEYIKSAEGGRIGRQEGGLMDLGGMEKDYRNDGGFVPLGGEEKADDVPARLSRNEFVFTADAVKNAGGGDIDKGAEVMENVMKNLEAGGKVSEESQGQGAQDMFQVSERLSEVV